MFWERVDKVSVSRYVLESVNYSNWKCIMRTSRRRTRSWTRFMIWAIVAFAPPSPFEGFANSIAVPSRRRPRDRRRLFT